ncbi:MAG: hypothetical protein AAFR04_11465 [Pseudomonadota bacterium]
MLHRYERLIRRRWDQINVRADKMRPRYAREAARATRNTGSFLVWTFIIAQVLSKNGLFFGDAKARTFEPDLEAPQSGASDATPATALAVAASDSEAEDETLSGYDGLLGARDDTPGFAPDDDDAEAGDDDLPGDTTPTPEPRRPGPDGPVGSSTPPAPITSDLAIDPPPATPVPLPQLEFFDGLGNFYTDLGLGPNVGSLADLVGTSAQGEISYAFTFVANPLAPVSYWQGDGDLSSELQPSDRDGFDVDWAIQASGIVDGQTLHLQDTNGSSSQSQFTQSGLSEDKAVGNSATLVDGQDWDGALWVHGNYYEFNTIIQINVLWDEDIVSVVREGDTAQAVASPQVISTGDNAQVNTAHIVSVDPTVVAAQQAAAEAEAVAQVEAVAEAEVAEAAVVEAAVAEVTVEEAVEAETTTSDPIAPEASSADGEAEPDVVLIPVAPPDNEVAVEAPAAVPTTSEPDPVAAPSSAPTPVAAALVDTQEPEPSAPATAQAVPEAADVPALDVPVATVGAPAIEPAAEPALAEVAEAIEPDEPVVLVEAPEPVAPTEPLPVETAEVAEFEEPIVLVEAPEPVAPAEPLAVEAPARVEPEDPVVPAEVTEPVAPADMVPVETDNVGTAHAEPPAPTAPTATTAEPAEEALVHQMVLGGYEAHHAAVQVNAIVDFDDIFYSLEDDITGGGLFEDLGVFADVMSSGHSQTNDAHFYTHSSAAAAPDAANAYYHFGRDDQHIEEIDGNYFEFNTIFQVNIISDRQEFDWITNGGNDQGDIASGGNFMFNEATILSNDHQDDLFVSGQYTEYNLVLQINSIEDNDTIHQHSALDHTGSADPLNVVGADGDDGEDGGIFNVSVPGTHENAFDRLTDGLF